MRQLHRILSTAAAIALLSTLSPVATRSSAALAQGAAPAAVFDVKSYGATGNGTTNDSPAIDKAITAANSAGGGTVEFPAGTYKSANTVHLKSHVTLQLDAGSKVLGSTAKTYDAAEPNPYDAYQDYGHSHFHDAMFYGDNLTDIGFTGSGTIDGGGALITGNPGAGQADKILSLTRCHNLTLNGVTLARGGHFGALINGCDTVTSDHLTIATAADRDGWNIISTTHVTITDITIASNDDALVFKSDYALGAKLPNGHVTVFNAMLSAQCCNALMIGSETCGDFTDYRFQQITVTGAGKSGLGLVSMDGADISDVHYQDVTMTGVHSPIMEKVGTRLRCGGSPTVGHITGVTYDNVTGTGTDPSFSPTLWGATAADEISDITFTGVHLTVPGGSAPVSAGVPANNPTDYNPNSIGTRPAYGWYLHDVSGVRFIDSSVRFAAADARPAILADHSTGVTFAAQTAQPSTTNPYDIGFQSVSGYCVTGQTPTGTPLRISATSSTGHCPPATRYEAENATLSPGAAIATNHAGYSGTGFVDTANAVGSSVTWTITVPAAGLYTATIGYANGTTTNRPMDIAANGGTTTAGAPFPGTGAWSTWSHATYAVRLPAGTSTVRVSATTAAGCPNLDYLDITPTTTP